MNENAVSVAVPNKGLAQRNSSLEVLRLIAVFLIVYSHILPYFEIFYFPYPEVALGLNIASFNPEIIGLVFIRYGGQIGDALFIMISAYFLVDSDHLNVKKVFRLLFDNFLVSVLCLLIVWLSGYKPTNQDILASFFPTILNSQYFITAYLIFYLLHPYLHILVKSASKKQLWGLSLTLFVIYSIIDFFVPEETLFYNQLTGFFCLYFIVAYLKKYAGDYLSVSRSWILLLVSFVFCFIFILFKIIFGLSFKYFSSRIMEGCSYVNPFIIGISYGLISLFSKKEYHSRAVNFFAQFGFLIYIVTDNILFRRFFRYNYFAYIYFNFTYQHIFLICLASGALAFLGSMAVSIVYNYSFGCLTRLAADKISSLIKKRFSSEKT